MTQYFTHSAALKGALYMILAGLCFALVNTALQGATMRLGASAPSTTFWQYVIAFIVCIPWVLHRGRAAFKTSHLGAHILRVGLAAGGVQLWTFGLSYVPIWQAIALILLSPFFVTIGAFSILNEPVSQRRWSAVLLGMIGGMIILEPWSDQFVLAALLPVGAAAFWAASSIVAKRLTDTESADTITLYLLLLLSPINAGLAIGSGFRLPPDALYLVLGAGLLTAFAQYILVRAYSLADAAYLQPFDHIKLLFNVLLGFVVFGFLPSGSMILGAAIIILAAGLMVHRNA